jgi:hypothetical protein
LSPGIHLGEPAETHLGDQFRGFFLQKWWFKHGKHVF